MTDLEGFGKVRQEKPARRSDARKPAAQRPAAKPAGPRPRRKLDLDAAPDGYDADVWDVARFFEELAEERGFQLAAGRPVLYAKLADRIEKSGIKDVKDYRDTPLKWVPMIKVMIIDFWDDEVWLATAAHAIDQFCGVEMFDTLRHRILRDRETGLVRQEMASRPKKDTTFRGRTPEAQARVDARVRAAEAEQAATIRHPARPRRSWDEIRAAVKRINGKGDE